MRAAFAVLLAVSAQAGEPAAAGIPVFSLTKSGCNGYGAEMGLLLGKGTADDLHGGFGSLEIGQEGLMLRAGFGAFWNGKGIGDLSLGAVRFGGVLLTPSAGGASSPGAEISYSFWCLLLRGGFLAGPASTGYLGFGLGI